jgi:hypothetical protein
MSYYATLGWKQSMSSAAHAARDLAVTSGKFETVWQVPELLKELEQTSYFAEAKLISLAKKMGLTLQPRKDGVELSYGIHGHSEGPLDMWFQVST